MNERETGNGLSCHHFHLKLYHFQADELSERERQPLQDHLDGCEICARRLAVEDALLSLLKMRLRRAPAPPELQGRVRAALHGAPRRGWVGWLRSPWLTAAAASLLLLVLLVPAIHGLNQAPALPPQVILDREVTLVDLDCDRSGVSLDEQRRCNHPHHINALRLGRGKYWNLNLDGAEARLLVLAREMRGHRLRVEGEFHPALRTLRLSRFADLGFP